MIATLELSSTQSLQTSLLSLKAGIGGLDAHRSSMLNRVPDIGDWAQFKLRHLEMKDLAYLTAKTGHEFAILRGKNEDILFHGEVNKCSFEGILVHMLRERKLILVGHSHPCEKRPIPSSGDRNVLREIGQSKSKIISGLTGYEIEFSCDPFEI